MGIFIILISTAVAHQSKQPFGFDPFDPGSRLSHQMSLYTFDEYS